MLATLVYAAPAAAQAVQVGSVITYPDGTDEASAILLDWDELQLEVLGADVAIQSGTISETGGSRPLEKIGTGTLIVSGDNSYSGGTLISGGTLALAHDNGAGSGTITIAGDATLASVRPARSLFGGVVSSAGGGAVATIRSDDDFWLAGQLSGGDFAFATTSPGSADVERVILSAVNSYGATTVGTGLELAVTGDGTLGSGDVAIAADGYLRFDVLSAPMPLANRISGDGSVIVDTDDLTLGGDNSYSGGTILDGGGLAAGSASAFGTGSFLHNGGTLTVAIGVALEIGAFEQTGGTFDLNGEQALVASLTGSAGAITNGTLVVDGGETAYAGLIEDGSGVTTLRLQNGADLTLTGSNNFTGYLDVYDSTLTLGHDEAAGGSGNIIYTAGDLATVRFDDGVVNASGIDLDALDTQLFVAAGESAEQSGDISSCYCAGLTKTGDGTLTLSGFNSYTGTTSILGGTLAVTLGGVVASEWVEIGNGARLQGLEDAVTGGAMTILASGGTIDSGDYTFLVGGSTDFQGALTKTGSGTLVLLDMFEEGTGAGGIDVTAGTLALGSDYAAGTGIIKLADGTSLMNSGCDCLWIGNDIQVAAGGTATIDGFGVSTVLGGSISGGNVHFFTDPGTGPDPFASTFELTGANSYDDSLIGANVAVILTDGTLGNGDVVFDDVPSHPDFPAALVFASTGDYNYGGTISGAGLVSIETDDPATTITLSGSNTAAANFTGTLDVLSGRLAIDGDFGDVVGNSATLNLAPCGCSDATLGGSGTFHGNVALDVATLAPGNSPGTLTIAGNLTLGGGTILNFELDAPGVVGGGINDLINVGGILTLDGTLNTIAFGPGYGPGYYRLFNYAGGLVDNGLDVGSIAGGLSASVFTDIGGQVNLRLGGAAQTLQYWDGSDSTGTSAAPTGDGGIGTWNASGSNWTAPIGYAVNHVWQSEVGVFAGAAGGTVTVGSTQAFQELRFQTDGYLLRPLDAAARLGTVGGFSILDVDAGITADIGVVIEGPGGVTKTGGGTLLLSAVNSYTGTTDIAAGTLRIGTDFSLANASALTISAGATFDLDGFHTRVGSLAGAGGVTMGAGELNVGYDNSSTLFSGTITATDGSGATLTKEGGGTLTLAGAVTLATGGSATPNWIKVNAGALAVSGSGDVATDYLQSFATIDNGGTITAFTIFQNFGTVSNSGTIAGTTQNFGTFDNYGTTGSLQSLSGTAANHGTGTIDGTVQSFADFTSTGIINGDVANFGAMLLENQVNGALANLTAGASVTLTGTVTGITRYQGADGSVLGLAGFDTAIGSLAGTGAIQLGAATLTIGDATSATFNGTIAGSGGLIKTQGGDQALNGVHSYVGPTTVSAGTLAIDVGGSVTSNVTVASGASFVNDGTVNGWLINDGALTLTGALQAVTPEALHNGVGAVVDASGVITGAVQNIGAFTVTGTLTGVTRFEQAAGGALYLPNHDLTLGALAGAGTVDLGLVTLSIGAGNLTSTFDGTISGAGGLSKSGTGDFTLNGVNSYIGQTTVGGGTFWLGSSGVIAGEVVNNASFVSTGVVVGGLDNSGTALVRGELGGLVQNRSGSITLTGLTTGIGPVEQVGGALFDLGGFDTEIGSLSGGGVVALGNAALVTGGDDSDTHFAGTLTGGVSGRLTKAGIGTLTLTGASTYGGGTTIDAGTLLLGDGAALGTGDVTNNATLTFDATTDFAFDNAITGSGSLIKSGANVVTLTNWNDYAGGTWVVGGVLALASDGSAGSGAIALGDGTTLRNGSAGVLALWNDIAIAGTATIDGANSSPTLLDGTLSGGTARFAGTAAFALNGANSHIDTVIGANTAVIVAGGTLGTGDLAFENAPSDPLTPATLLFSRIADYSYGGTISGDGQIVVDALLPGVTVTLSGSNSAARNYTGDVRVSGGTLVLDGDFGDVLGNSASLLLDDAGCGCSVASLGGSGVFHGSITVASGALNPGNSPGTLTIAGDLTLGAGTILNYELGEAGTVGGANNDLIVVGGNLTLDGTLNVAPLPSFGNGYFRLIDYAGTLTDNGLAFGAMPAGISSTLLTNIAGQVNLLFQDGVQQIQYWDGADATGASAAVGGDGGAGSWSAGATNWTAPIGYAVNGAWAGQVGVFAGAAGGSVTISGIQAFQELRFVTDGYRLAGATAADGLATTGGFAVIDVAGGLAATIDATITGAGGLTKTGAGRLNLGGANSFAGTTTISTGTLAILAGGALAGPVVNDDTLDNAGTIAGRVTNNAVLTSTGVLGGGLINAGSAALVGQVNGAVSNSGAIVLTGATAGIGAVTQTTTGSFDLNGNDTVFASLAGGGIVELGAALLTTNADGSSTNFAGAISGAGSVTKAGTGTLTLSGANSHAGVTTVGAGSLAVAATGSLAGDVRNAATFTNDGTVDGTLRNTATATNSGALSGGVVNAGSFASTGAIGQVLVNTGTASLRGQLNGELQNDAGAVTLSGSVSGITLLTQQAGATTDLAGFDLTVGAFSGAGAILLGAARIATGSDGQNRLFAGTLSGSGGVTKTGAGALVLTGSNSYTGTTVIAAGTLQLGAGGTSGALAGGAVTSNGTFAVNRSDAVTLSNAISGTGMFAQIGTGITTLTAANSYSGGTLVSAGRLRGDTASLQRDIRADAALEFAQASAGSFAGRLSGIGLVEKTGAGNLSLTGDSSTFTGATRVLGGRLGVNGLLSRSIVTVGSGATLGGTGIVGGIVAQNGSTIAPGNSVGMLGVAGNVQFQAGSLFAVEIQPSGADRVDATGTAQLAGTLAITNLGGNYAFNSSYVLIEADAGRTGTFDLTTGLAGFGPTFRPRIVYTATQVQLLLAPNQISAIVGSAPLSENQASTAARFDAAILAGHDPAALDALLNLTPAQVPAALDTLSGEAYASATRAMLEDERLVREAALGRAREAADRGLSGPGGWGQIVGSWGDADADGNAAAYDLDRSGLLVGIDTGAATEKGSWRAGLIGQHIRTVMPIPGRASRVEIEQTGGGFYAGVAAGGFQARFGMTLAHLELGADRRIGFAGFTDSARGKTRGRMFQSFAEFGYRIEGGEGGFVEPFVTGSLARVKFDAFRESGGAARLAIGEQDQWAGVGVAGLRGETSLRNAGRSWLRVGGSIGLRHVFGDRAGTPLVALVAAPAHGFGLRSAAIDRDALVGNLDVTADITNDFSLRIGYTGVQGRNARDHGARATLSLRF